VFLNSPNHPAEREYKVRGASEPLPTLKGEPPSERFISSLHLFGFTSAICEAVEVIRDPPIYLTLHGCLFHIPRRSRGNHTSLAFYNYFWVSYWFTVVYMKILSEIGDGKL